MSKYDSSFGPYRNIEEREKALTHEPMVTPGQPFFCKICKAKVEDKKNV